MRKVFYIDRALLIISLTLFIIYFKNIEGIGTILIYSTFFTFNIYLNLLMNKVNKYKRESKMSFKEKLDCIPLILGKLLSIIQILLMGVYLENNGMNTILILFMFQSFLILDYSYIYKNQIIAIKSKPLDLKNISNLIVGIDELSNLGSELLLYSCNNVDVVCVRSSSCAIKFL